MDDESAELAAAFDAADEFEVPPDDEWGTFNLTDVSQGNRAVRLLRRMRRNRKAVLATALVDYDRIERVYREKRAEVDQFVDDRLGRQDKAEPWLEQQVIALAGRELDERLAENPKAPKTVHFVGAQVSSRKVGGQPTVEDRDAWLPWAVDHDEVNEESPCTLTWTELAHIDSLLSRLDGLAVKARDIAERDGGEVEIPAYDTLRSQIELAQQAIALAQAQGARPLFTHWEDRYYWFSGHDVVHPETGEVVDRVPPAWYAKGDWEPKPVPGVGRVDPGRHYTLTLDEEM